jgi:hypothetical protein
MICEKGETIMTTNGSDPSLFFVFGYRGARMADGPHFIRSAASRREAEDHPRAVLADRRWSRTVADNVSPCDSRVRRRRAVSRARERDNLHRFALVFGLSSLQLFSCCICSSRRSRLWTSSLAFG